MAGGGEMLGSANWVEPTPSAIDELADLMKAAERGVVPTAQTMGMDCGARWGWNPAESDLLDDRLVLLLNRWNQLRGDALMPPVVAIDPVELAPALGYIMLLDVVEDCYDCRYRLYGTGISAHAGRDWTGALVSEMNRRTGTNVALFYRAGYRAIYRRPTPMYTWHRSPRWITAASWRRLILPFAGPDGAVARFLVGNIPGDLHYLSDEEQAEQEQKLKRDDRAEAS